MEREQKNIFFAEHSQSPILFEGCSKFTELDYYPPNPDYCFELELHEHCEKKKMEIEDAIGNVRNLIRWGEFHFKAGSEECKLQAYKTDSEEERLFIPFRDSISGKQTYGAGRYLDLNPEKHFMPEGKLILDFNRAYNPWCVYNKNYACPFVPPENWFKVEICAGEKDYPHST